MLRIYFCLLFVAIVLGQKRTVYVYDLREINSLNPNDAYEYSLLVTTLQGLVNRNDATLYITLIDQDFYWLQYLQQDEWFQDVSIQNISGIVNLVSQFSAFYNGVVLYDPNIAATSNVATTSAAAEDLLPICYRSSPTSLYSLLIENGPQLPIKRNLVGIVNGNITGSTKCDSYIYAINEFILSGKSDLRSMGYYIDYFWTKVYNQNNLPYSENDVTNRDYFVSKRAFFWDLDVWPDEAPNDDPNQVPGTDMRTLEMILAAAYNQTKGLSMIHVGGFTPWAFKYVDQKHGGVATEWQTTMILSSYNAYLDADACCLSAMSNAAFFTHYPIADRFIQNPAPSQSELERQEYIVSGNVTKKMFYMFYIGDYDSAAWFYRNFKENWDDPARGKIPLGWAPNPNLMERFPVLFPYLFKTLSPNDRIVTGDSGAGYVNPTAIIGPRVSGYPSAEGVWIEHNRRYYRRFDIKFTGFLINGASGSMNSQAESMYGDELSRDGMVEQWGYSKGVHLTNGAPVFQEVDLTDDVDSSVEKIMQYFKPGVTQFMVFRSVLKSASFHLAIAQNLSIQTSGNAVVVDPITLGYLARIYLGGENNNRITYINDSIPTSMKINTPYQCNFWIRNEGWNVLSKDSVFLQVSMQNQEFNISMSTDLLPQEIGVIEGNIGPFSEEGLQEIYYELVETPSTPFSIFGNLPWTKLINVY